MVREKWQETETARQCTNTYKQCRYMYIHCLYGVGVVVCRQPKEEKKACGTGAETQLRQTIGKRHLEARGS